VMVVAVAGSAAFADASSPARTAAAKRIAVDDDYFSPRSTRVRRGGLVTFVWRGERRHDVLFTSAPRRAKPKNCRLQRTGRCTRRLRKAGTYRYLCTLHANMTGKFRVR